jgi:hypothetical protein
LMYVSQHLLLLPPKYVYWQSEGGNNSVPLSSCGERFRCGGHCTPFRWSAPDSRQAAPPSEPPSQKACVNLKKDESKECLHPH